MWITGYSFRLDDARASVEVEGHLQMKKGVLKFSGRLNEVVQVDRVIKATKISQTCHLVDVVVFA